MLDEGIVEPLQDPGGELRQLLPVLVDHRNDLLGDHVVDEPLDGGRIESVHHRLAAHLQGDGDHTRVRSVQDADLLVAELLDRRHENDVQPRLVQRKFLHHLLVALSADGPEVVQLGLHHEVVVIADLLLDLADLLAREARHDAVHKRVAEVAVLFDPVDEVLPQLVIFGMADDIFVQRRAVVLDQFAADDAQALRRIAVEMFETLVQQRRHLGGIRLRRTGRQVVALLVADARLGGVRNGDLQLRREEIRLVFRIVHIEIERIHDALHQPHVLLGPFVLDALQIDVVHVVLPVHQVDHPQHLALGVDDRLANGHACIHDALLVGDVDLPVHEGSQEVAFAELQDANGTADRFDGRLVQLLDHCMSGF